MKAPNSTNLPDSIATSTSTFTSALTSNQSFRANWPAWNSYISNVPVPGAGCFEVTYPSTVWQASKCGTAASIPLRPSPATIGGAGSPPVGNGNDEVAYSSGTLIGSSFGSFQSVTGLTSETNVCSAPCSGVPQGPNEFSLQVNAQTFALVGTPYTNNQPLTCVYPTYVCGWEQFVFLNDPSGFYGTQIYIQYWLLNYYTNYGYCPSTAPPGGGFNGKPWYDSGGSCVSNSPNYPSLTSETAPNLANLILKGYANFGSGFASCTTACDSVVICYSGAGCYAVAITDQVVNLYQHWHYSEFNIFGLGDYSEAEFNSGTTITVANTLKDQSANVIVPSCVNTGYTGETNNLNLAANSCSPNSSNGQIAFSESNALVTFNTNPTSFLGASSPGSISACSSTFTNGQSSTGCGGSFSATANLPSPSSQWQFHHWEWSGGVTCTSNTANPTSCTVSSSGSLNAVYAAQIIFYTNPSTIGSISWGSCSNPGYTNGQTRFDPNLPPEFSNTFTVCANAPSGYAFASWGVSGGLSVSTSNPTTTATFTGPGTITASFNQVVTTTQSITSTASSTTSTTTSSTSTFLTTTTAISVSTSTVGQVCTATSTTQTTSIIIQGTVTTPTTTTTTTSTTTTGTSTFLTTTSSTSTSTTITTTTVTVCSQTSTSTTTSTTLTTFTRPSTSITLSASPNSVAVGSSVTLSGSISPNPGAVAVTISFSRDSGTTWTMLLSIMANGSGAYSTGWNPPSPGNYLLEVSWSGNNQLAPSQSSPASLTVTGSVSSTPTVLLSAPATTPHGQNVTLSVTVFNPASSALNANVTIEITGPNNYVLFDVIQVKVGANSQSTGYYDWAVPIQTGSYTVMVSLLPLTSGGVDVEAIQVT